MTQQKYPLPKVGEKFGKLTVIGFAGRERRMDMISCRCECGTEKIVQKRHLQQGLTRSCGCLRKKVVGVTAFGETKSVTEWSEDPRCVVTVNALMYRIRAGNMSPEQAITAPSIR